MRYLSLRAPLTRIMTVCIALESLSDSDSDGFLLPILSDTTLGIIKSITVAKTETKLNVYRMPLKIVVF